MGMKTNTFVIPHLVRPDLLQNCLESLWTYTPENFKVIVIDQNPLENVYSRIKPLVHLCIKSYRNLGFAKAMNTGIRLADTDYVTILNDDVEFVDKRWWPGVLEQFEDTKNAAGINPSALYNNLNGENKNTTKLQELGITERDEAYEKRNDPDLYGKLLGTGVLDGICTFCTVIPMDVIKTVGLLDEKFYPGSGEDYDWNTRAFIRGMRVLGTERSWIWHWWLSTKTELGKLDRELWQHAKPWNDLKGKWGDGYNLFGHDLEIDDIPPTTIVEL